MKSPRGWLVLWAVAVPMGASAYPVFIRAASNIDLSMGRDGPRMIVRGRLARDDAAPIPGASVDLQVGDRRVLPLVTDPEGRFEWSDEVPLGEYTVIASWAGREDVDGAEARRDLHFGKSDVTLDVVVPAQIDRSRPGCEVEVRARAEAGAAGLAVELHATDARILARGKTDSRGLARLTLVPRALGPPGPVVVEARSAADALRSAGHGASSTILVARSTIALAGPLPESVPAGGELDVAGTLSDEERPIAGGAIEVRVADVGRPSGQRAPSGEAIVRTATDDRGAFEAVVPFEGLRRGTLQVTIRYRPGATWRSDAVVGPLSVEHLAPAPVPVGLALVPILVTAVAVGAALRGARRRRRPAAPSPARAWAAPAQGGVRASRASSAAPRSSRRPPDFEVTGRVWDPTQRRAVSSATVVIEAGGTTRTVPCAQEGRFSTGPLEAGEARLEVTAPGYEPQRFTASIPHHGDLRDVRVDLVPIRHRVMEVYREAALRHLPERALWGFWTPRELVRFVRSRGDLEGTPLGPLTDLFEEVYYADRGATLEELARARLLAAGS